MKFQFDGSQLSSRPNGVEVELDGAVIGRLLPPASLSVAEQAALLTRGRELVRRARQKNKGAPARLLVFFCENLLARNAQQ